MIVCVFHRTAQLQPVAVQQLLEVELFGKPAQWDAIDGEPLSPEDVKGLVAQLVEAQQLETAAPDGLDPKVCNSKTHHKEWVAYDRKLTTQKALKLHPSLVEQFKDPSKKNNSL